ncbi:hypothetical protein M0R45_007781 [Rubus argutus]|uniref:Uncharacterized protein n=1 Tax=Rubus argutus TaxID=59490 RepID=A0AAW1Y2N9_RUBAR
MRPLGDRCCARKVWRRDTRLHRKIWARLEAVVPWTSGDTENDRSLFDALPEKHLIFWNGDIEALTLFDSTFSNTVAQWECL